MFTFLRRIFLFIVINQFAYAFDDYHVKISNNGPVVFGANITFTAELRLSGGEIPDGEYKYKWRDNLYPQNMGEFLSNTTCNWTVHYSADKYHKAGIHWVDVTVYTEKILIDWPLCRDLKPFELTENLNGNLTLLQDNITKVDLYISNSTEVVHKIDLTRPDLEYIEQNSNSIKTYWYINCEHAGSSNGLTYRHNYTQADVTHFIDVLLVVSNISISNNSLINVAQPLLNLSVSHENSSVELTTSSDVLLNTLSDSSNSTKFSYEIFDNTTISKVPFNCQTKQISLENDTITYGIFSRKIRVKAPVLNVTAIGNQWLQHSDMLNLEVTCQGSPPFKFCYKVIEGYYNATGNETCDFEDVLETCAFKVFRYFQNSTHYSVLLIIRNDINNVIRSIGIDVYEATKLPQLSVIVVPISASIVAVVLIIFGIAYYIQSRNRFIIEVADFDFSTSASDMEYKTFRERLVEAFHNSFDKTEDFYEQDSTNKAPTNKKYGSMP